MFVENCVKESSLYDDFPWIKKIPWICFFPILWVPGVVILAGIIFLFLITVIANPIGVSIYVLILTIFALICIGICSFIKRYYISNKSKNQYEPIYDSPSEDHNNIGDQVSSELPSEIPSELPSEVRV